MVNTYNPNQAKEIALHYHNLVIGINALEGKGYPPEELNPFQIAGNTTEAFKFFSRQNPYNEDTDLREGLKIEELEKRLEVHDGKLRQAQFGKVTF